MSKPTLESLYQQISIDLSNALEIKDHRFSILEVISKSIAAVAFSLYCYIDFVAKNLMPDSASKEILERWSAIWGVYRKPASYSLGQVIFSGINGAVIPKDLRVQSLEGLIYTTQSTGIIQDGVASLPVKAVNPGQASNLNGKSPLTISGDL